MSFTRKAVLGAIVGAATLFPAGRSEACGGFFCNNVPVEQAGEKILFVMDDGHVTAHVQIQYSGPSESFSWVVPTTVVPEIGVGTDEIFSILSSATAPYVSQTWTERNCGYGYGGPYRGGDAAVDADADSDGDADYGEGGVDVLQSSIVGPFETVTLDSDDPEALIAWLHDNDYVVPPAAEPIIAAYVASNAYFVGLKLTKSADVGDLQPIVLDMDTSEACVPLRLTAIAAQADMPVYAYFVADARAVSTNFPEVVLDDVLLHDPSALGGGYLYGEGYADPYTSLVTDAVDAAGGRAFATDYAGASWPLLAAIDAGRYDTARIASLADPQSVMNELMAQRFGASQLLLGILLEFMPPPDGVEARDFYNSPSSYVGAEYVFDAAGLAEALESRIAAPLRDIQSDVARHTHLTRLFTTISPEEMTEDPTFGLNPSLPLVDRELRADVVRDCRGTTGSGDDYEEITTAAGHHFCTAADGSSGAPDVPAYERLVQQATSGPGLVIEDRSAEIDAALSCGEGSIPPRGSRGACDGGACEEGGLCAATPGVPAAGGATVFAFVAIAVVAVRRRSR